MYCPHTITFNSRFLMITRHERTDYHFGAPLKEKLNPLRYSVTIFPGTSRNRTFNRDGRLARTLSDILFMIRALRPTEQPMPAPPPVDRTQCTLVDGSPVTRDHTELKPNGQQKDYVVLSAEERAKGFVRPVRRTYVHQKCGVATTMGRAIAETYARDPYFYSGTFCVGCGSHFPVGEAGEFTWDDGTKVGT